MTGFWILHERNLRAMERGGFRPVRGKLGIKLDHKFLGALVIDTPEASQNGSGSGKQAGYNSLRDEWRSGSRESRVNDPLIEFLLHTERRLCRLPS